ncbi:MAG: urease accessory protein UreD [Deltaproteobacteria bacterium]|nr:urease accessory protein UreD [Deltaproteobacteria bacterium]
MVESHQDKPGWRAELSLEFGRTGEKTILRRQRHRGPLQVQRPFYPEGDRVCHVYILHPPGGVVGGDTLEISVSVTKDVHALVTTPAAGKFYRSSGPNAQQTNLLKVGAGGTLEWFPQETIFFNQAKAHVMTRVDLEPGARFIGWDIACLGLPASGEKFLDGSLIMGLDIWRGGEPIMVERSRIEGRSPAMTARWGLAGYSVTGCLVCTTDDRKIIDKIRYATKPLAGNDLFAVTTVSGMAVCRYLGPDAFRATRYFIKAWETLRPAVLNLPACLPRVWQT